jgi:excisionase family DNA binding protein
MPSTAAVRTPQPNSPLFNDPEPSAPPIRLVRSAGQPVAARPGDATSIKRPQSELPTLLTCLETANLLRTSMKAVYAMVERRQVPFVRIGRRVLFRRDSLIDWLRQKSNAVA